MSDSEIIQATLREIPVGYIPSHTPENLPELVAYYVTEHAKQCNKLEKIEHLIATENEPTLAQIKLIMAS